MYAGLVLFPNSHSTDITVTVEYIGFSYLNLNESHSWYQFVNSEYIYQIIEQAVNACVELDAITFCSLFAEDGEIILQKNQRIPKAQIERVTGNYFANLEYVKITISSMKVQDNCACVEWLWEDFNRVTQQENHHKNLIMITFDGCLMQTWQEELVKGKNHG